jgi:DNA mismatch repair protein MutL
VSCRIRILDDALVDQIAAGEVVERPASLVKELLENAVDAGAATISVESEEGGVSTVRVVDDGAGMTAEEVSLSVRRHATSKLSSLQDLSSISTLGFRGEALPSIASVSRFTLTSRTADAVSGTRVVVEGGSEIDRREVGCSPGTSVEVRDLFYNVPARRKFLKSRSTENAHLTTACLRTALAHPRLRLTLIREGRKALEYLPVDSILARARSAFRGEELIGFHTERDGVRITAALGAPERARSGSANLHVFVNGRPVRDPQLLRAVVYAYGSVLPKGRYPVGAVHIDIDPGRIDVNVHPQKLEIRFEKPGEIFRTVMRSIAGELGTSAWSGPAARGGDYWTRRLASDALAGKDGGTRPESIENGTAPDQTEPRQPPPADPWGLSGTGGARPADAVSYEIPPTPRTIEGVASSGKAPEGLFPARGFWSALRVMGQVRELFIVCESDDALHIIDQHAADERVKFDRLRREYRAREIESQRLLFPERVECTAEEMTTVRDRMEVFRETGLDCEIIGPTSVAVHAVPALLDRAPPERLFRDLLAEAGRSGDRTLSETIDAALATMACHGAVRAGDSLTNEEAAALLRCLDEVADFAGHCPHGRPVVYSVRFDDLERRLGR